MDDLLEHLERLTGAERPRLRQLVGEVIGYYEETALEGAQKLEEMPYVHAEAYPAA